MSHCLPNLRLSVLFLGVLATAAAAQVPAPVFTPRNHAAFVTSVTVTIEESSSGSNGKIYYTTDGSNPAPILSQEYDGNPLVFRETTTLRAVRYRGLNASPVTVGTYVQAALPPPTARYGAKREFADPILCTLSVSPPGQLSDIRYSLGGGASQAYAGPIRIDRSVTLTAAAARAGWATSPTLTERFTRLEKVLTPTASPDSGSFANSPLTVRLKSGTPGAAFYYTFAPHGRPDSVGKIAVNDSLLVYGGAILDTVTLRVVAVKSGMAASDVLTAKYRYAPRVEEPRPSRLPGPFTDTMTVAFSSTPGADIRCTTDGTIPSEGSAPCNLPMKLADSVTVKAVAFRPGQQKSTVFSGLYRLRLSAPRASPQGTNYSERIVVTLSAICPGATIKYELDGSDPGVGSPIFNPGDSIPITGDLIQLRAVATKGLARSPVTSWDYRRTDTQSPAAPTIEPGGREFLDSVLVTITSKDPEALVYYTQDGTPPRIDDPAMLYKGVPVLLRNDVTLMAIAHKKGSSSPTSTESFKLALSPPVPFPEPGSYPNRVEVRLTAKSSHPEAQIWYTEAATFNKDLAKHFTPGTFILLEKPTRLIARTYLGATFSANEMTAFYDVYKAGESDTLKPGDPPRMLGNHSFTNPASSAAAILARSSAIAVDGIRGFAGSEVGILLSPIGSSAFPKIVYEEKGTHPEMLYRLNSAGKVELVAVDGKADLTKPGLYFAAVDTLPPVIRIVSQEAKPGEATIVKASVEDNVLGPACRVESPGLPEGKIVPLPGNDGLYSFTVKNPAEGPASLWLRIQAKDQRNTSWYPPDSAGRFLVSQAWTKVVSGAILEIGANPEQPWDLIGLPLSRTSGLTWGRLKRENDQEGLHAVAWINGKLDTLEDNDKMPPVAWLGRKQALASLAVPNLESGSTDPDGNFRVTLKPGWNVVANPGWDKLYWPLSHKDPRASEATIKGIWEAAPFSPDEYERSDSLEVWKGYFVHRFGATDTTVILRKTPPPAALARTASLPLESSLRVGLQLPEMLPGILGAAGRAEDGYGAEDEPRLPGLKRGPRIWAQRGAARLMTDFVRFRPDGVATWTVILDPGESRQGGPLAARISSWSVPAGFEVWALNRARGLKTRLGESTYLTPGSHAQPDTLEIFAGPLAKLAAIEELKQSRERVHELEWSLEPARKGLLLRMTVPPGTRVQAELWTPTGRRISGFAPRDLREGRHVLGLDAPEAGLGLLRLRVMGKGGEQVFVRKLIFP